MHVPFIKFKPAEFHAQVVRQAEEFADVMFFRDKATRVARRLHPALAQRIFEAKFFRGTCEATGPAEGSSS
eukprot:s2890_g3.t1